jgi:hypothetical protein
MDRTSSQTQVKLGLLDRISSEIQPLLYKLKQPNPLTLTTTLFPNWFVAKIFKRRRGRLFWTSAIFSSWEKQTWCVRYDDVGNVGAHGCDKAACHVVWPRGGGQPLPASSTFHLQMVRRRVRKFCQHKEICLAKNVVSNLSARRNWRHHRVGNRPLYTLFRRDYYCKRTILCLSSSKILTPYPPLRPASVYPPPWLGGRTVSPGGEGMGGQYSGRRET